MRIALNARASKSDGSQHPDNQLIPLRNHAKLLGGEVVKEYVDSASGGGVADRTAFLQMLKDSDNKQFDLLIIWSLDRFSREGISTTLGYLQRLKRSGVAVISLTEPWLDTRDEGLGQLLLAIFSWVAHQV